MTSGDRETLLGVLQDGFYLLAGYTREPLQKVIEPGAVLQVCKEGLNRSTRASEDPGTADLLRISFDGRALIPVKHWGERLREATN